MGLKNLFGKFFKDKKVLVTGHTGFIGSWLSIWLIELGADVTGYALAPRTENDNYVVTGLKNKMKSIIGDIRDYDKINKVFKKIQPDIIFHLAAQPIVRKSYNFPKETYDINIGGTVNIFETFRKNFSCKVLINFTTDKCYENLEYKDGYKEEDRLGGYDPYSSSKASSELITSAYRNSFFSSNLTQKRRLVSSVRSGNIIGGGDWQEDRLIPDCMRAIKGNKEILIRNKDAVRPWIFILEPIRGFLNLSRKMWEDYEDFSGAWNFGIDKNSIYSVEDIVNKIIKYLGKGKYNILSTNNSENFHETKFLLLDCAKAKRFLGWQPVFDIDKTLEFTCNWYMEDNVDYEFNIKQIEKYIKNIKIEQG